MLSERLINDAKLTPFGDLDHMQRYWCIPPRADDAANITARIHVIHASDKETHLHDHPWSYISVILDGAYYEVRHFPTEAAALTPDAGVLVAGPHYLREVQIWQTIRWYTRGSVLVRNANDTHRVLVREGAPATTLFIMGSYVNKWGFATPDGKVYWRDYLQADFVANQVNNIDQHYTSKSKTSGEISVPSIENTLARAYHSGDFEMFTDFSEILGAMRLEAHTL